MRHTRIKARKDRKARNSDGTLRRSNAPAKLTDRSLIARWVEAETVRLKREGFAFTAIAAYITAVGRGEKQPAIALPQVQWPANYQISAQACHKAYRAAMHRDPATEVADALEAEITNISLGGRLRSQLGEPRPSLVTISDARP